MVRSTLFSSSPIAALLLACALFAVAVPPGYAQGASAGGAEWLVDDGAGGTRVRLYMFWSSRCPHCRAALPFIARLRAEQPWIEVLDFEISADRDNVMRYVDMAAGLGEQAGAVPAFFVCGQMVTGYDNPEGIGKRLIEMARFCHQMAPDRGTGADTGAGIDAGPASPGRILVPVLGELEAGSLSLPVFTLVIAGLDAFNPCAFFVLLFLLSLMVHARSRRRMLLIGGTFVLFSGLVYFLFMAAWLNLFLVVGGTPVVTLVAGVVALLIGALNVKDFVWFQQGPSLSIPESAKPGLFRRMRGLVSADHLGTLLVGTVALALAANSYELLCTAGFPMVYTRVLTLNQLSEPAYYGYLALYNLVYVLPLLAIVLVFTFTLGARKLGERQGRALKLLSGLMMVGLGLVMLLAPERLSNPAVGALLLGAALLLTALVGLLTFRGRGL